jgi:hypothetical protein
MSAGSEAAMHGAKKQKAREEASEKLDGRDQFTPWENPG